MKIANWDKLIDFSIHRTGYNIQGKQLDILRSDKQIKIIRAARRTGKSFDVGMIAYTLVIYSTIINRPLKILFAGPRYFDSRNMWSHLNTFLKNKKAPIEGLTWKDNLDTPSTNKRYMIFSNGTEIRSASTESITMDDIRGEGWDFIAIDEFGNVDYKVEFMDAAAPSLKDENRLNLLMIIGTPDLSFGDAYDRLFEMGQDHNHPKIQSWLLTEADCPNVDIESSEVMDSLLSEDGRMRESFGEAIPSGGKLFPEFEYKSQVIPLKYDATLPYFIGIDPGRTKPAIEFIQASGENFNVFHEITGKDVLVSHLINEIELAIEVKCAGNQPIVVGIDKAGKAKTDKVDTTTIQEIKKHFPQIAFATAWALISKQNHVMLLRKLTMQKRLFIDPSCKRLATAMVRATPAGSRGKIEPGWEKRLGIDDPLDALMYGFINYQPELIVSHKKTPLTPIEDFLATQLLREFEQDI